MQALISAEYPVLIQYFVSTEATRYYLNGFYVHPDPNEGIRIVATDGHRMGVFQDLAGTWEGPGVGQDHGAIVCLDKSALKFLKAKSKKPRWLLVEGTLESNTATILEGDRTPGEDGQVPELETLCTFHKVLVDGSFPDYSRVVPNLEEKGYKPQSYNPAYVSDFAAICKKRSSKSAARIRIIAKDEMSPALVLTDREDFFGVLMPIRGGWEQSNTYPSFWTKPAERKGDSKALPPPAEESPPSPAEPGRKKKAA